MDDFLFGISVGSFLMAVFFTFALGVLDKVRLDECKKHTGQECHWLYLPKAQQ